MKCPNCRCEIGSQPVCPYCGRVIYQTAQRGWGEYAPQLYRSKPEMLEVFLDSLIFPLYFPKKICYNASAN